MGRRAAACALVNLPTVNLVPTFDAYGVCCSGDCGLPRSGCRSWSCQPQKFYLHMHVSRASLLIGKSERDGLDSGSGQAGRHQEEDLK